MVPQAEPVGGPHLVYSHNRLDLGELLTYVAVGRCQGTEIALERTQGLTLCLTVHLQGPETRCLTLSTHPSCSKPLTHTGKGHPCRQGNSSSEQGRDLLKVMCEALSILDSRHMKTADVHTLTGGHDPRSPSSTHSPSWFSSGPHIMTKNF